MHAYGPAVYLVGCLTPGVMCCTIWTLLAALLIALWWQPCSSWQMPCSGPDMPLLACHPHCSLQQLWLGSTPLPSFTR